MVFVVESGFFGLFFMVILFFDIVIEFLMDVDLIENLIDKVSLGRLFRKVCVF